MKQTTTTTYIGRDGEVMEVRRKEERVYYQVATPYARQIAVIKNIGEGLKITVTRIEPD